MFFHIVLEKLSGLLWLERTIALFRCALHVLWLEGAFLLKTK